MKSYRVRYLVLQPDGGRIDKWRVVKARSRVGAHESVRSDLVSEHPVPNKVLIMRVHEL